MVPLAWTPRWPRVPVAVKAPEVPALTLHVEAGGGSGGAQLTLGRTHVGAGIDGCHGMETQCVLLVHLVPVGHQLSISAIFTPGDGPPPPYHHLPAPGEVPMLLVPLYPWHWITLGTTTQLHGAASYHHCVTRAPHDGWLFCGVTSRPWHQGWARHPPPTEDPWLTQDRDVGTTALPFACRVGCHADVEPRVAAPCRGHLQLPLGDHVPVTGQVQGHPILLPGDAGLGVTRGGHTIQLQNLASCGHQITWLQAEVVPQCWHREGTP